MAKGTGFRHAAALMFGQDIGVSAINFATNAAAARWLGPYQLGLFYIASLITNYAEKFGRLGAVDQAAIYLIGRRRDAAPKIVGHLVITWLTFAVIPLMGLLVFEDELRSWVVRNPDVTTRSLWIALGVLPFLFLNIAFTKILIAINEVRWFGAVQMIRALINFFLCLLFWRLSWDYVGLVFAFLASELVGAALGGLVVWRKVGIDPRPSRPVFRELFSYGWLLYASTLAIFIHQRFDLLYIASRLSPEQVSFYATAVLIAQLLWKIPNAVTSLVFAKVSAQDRAERGPFAARAFSNTAYVLVASALVLALVGYPAVRIVYGTRFIPAIPPILILLPGVVAMGLANLLVQFFFGSGQAKTVVRLSLVCAAVNISLNLLLVSDFGIIGAAWSSVASYSLNLALLIRAFRAQTGIPVAALFRLDPRDTQRYLSLAGFGADRTRPTA